MPSQLEQLSAHTVVVADTGNLEDIARFKPRDATTNPSLVVKAAKDPQYAELIEGALQKAKAEASDLDAQIEAAIDHLFVDAGVEILKIVEGRVSTEVDARLSYDTQASLAKAKRLIGLYEAQGISRDRVLIKLASTWEGIQAARQLEEEGIHCNLTLLFSFAQAVACAEAKVTLISPFVGRIYDWYKNKEGVDDLPIESDPGVASVEKIYNYYKAMGYPVEVMGASFRKKEQVTALAGCDLLTISPNLLEELEADESPVEVRLSEAGAAGVEAKAYNLDQAEFLWMHNQDPMAVDKLSSGIVAFDKDLNTLRETLREKLA